MMQEVNQACAQEESDLQTMQEVTEFCSKESNLLMVPAAAEIGLKERAIRCNASDSRGLLQGCSCTAVAEVLLKERSIC